MESLTLKNMIELITRVTEQSLIDEPFRKYINDNVNSLLKMYLTGSLIDDAHQKV